MGQHCPLAGGLRDCEPESPLDIPAVCVFVKSKSRKFVRIRALSAWMPSRLAALVGTHGSPHTIKYIPRPLSHPLGGVGNHCYVLQPQTIRQQKQTDKHSGFFTFLFLAVQAVETHLCQHVPVCICFFGAQHESTRRWGVPDVAVRLACRTLEEPLDATHVVAVLHPALQDTETSTAEGKNTGEFVCFLYKGGR